jgi:hypothetical protein
MIKSVLIVCESVFLAMFLVRVHLVLTCSKSVMRAVYRFWLDRSTVRPFSRIVLACLEVAHEMRDNMQGLILTSKHPNKSPESHFFALNLYGRYRL